MKISIVTPCRNAAQMLPDTIESILEQSALKSGQVSFEHFIIDGASTDNTTEVVKPFLNDHISYSSRPDNGMYDALAQGFQHVSGDIVAYINAGDIYHPHAFEILAEVFEYSEINWVTGYSVLVNKKLQITAAWKPPRYRREFILNGTYLRGYPYPGIQQESTFWSRRVHSAIDFERLRQFRLAGDYFIWTELAKCTELHSIMSFLGAFRIHSGQLSEAYAAYLTEARSLVRPPTWKENLTDYWETRCPAFLRGTLWNWILPRSAAQIFSYDSSVNAWKPN